MDDHACSEMQQVLPLRDAQADLGIRVSRFGASLAGLGYSTISSPPTWSKDPAIDHGVSISYLRGPRP